MDFHYSPADEAFRAELRTWLEANAPQASSHTDDPFMEDSPEACHRRREWHRRMHAAGWVGISWHKEYGGRRPP
jgi:alkylation response protein AidB-like acyl-CoA dehydrogenase